MSIVKRRSILNNNRWPLLMGETIGILIGETF
jgi:hypothetical protein